jgi:hypothetical protein
MDTERTFGTPEIRSLTRHARTRVGLSPQTGEAIQEGFTRSEERLFTQPLSNRDESPASFFLILGAGVTPAQGSVKPTVGFTLKLSSFLSCPLR